MVHKRGVLTIPPDLVAALEAEPKAKAAFEAAGESYRKGLMALLPETRDGAHRAARIDLVIKILRQ